MYKTSLNVRVSWFRHRVLVWTLFAMLSFSLGPSGSLAQQPSATISELRGTVLVNGREQESGTILNAGDVLETQAGASVVLTLSDGSTVTLGENTKIDIAVLTQHPQTGVRTSRLRLAYGWIRAFLSSEHQQEGSSFTVETLNAHVGVKFSQPDVEVSYDPAKQETVALARTVSLMVKNLLTDEEKIVPVGSIVIIVGLEIKIMTGAAAIETISPSETGTIEVETPETVTAKAGTPGTATTTTGTAATGAAVTGTAGPATAAGIGTGTVIAIGAGALTAMGGVAAVTVSSIEEEGEAKSGDWAGEDISFTMSDDSTTIDTLAITYRQPAAEWVVDPGGPTGSVGTYPPIVCSQIEFEDTARFGNIPITGNSFSINIDYGSGNSSYEVNGTFTAPTKVTVEFSWVRADLTICGKEGTPGMPVSVPEIPGNRTYTASPQ